MLITRKRGLANPTFFSKKWSRRVIIYQNLPSKHFLVLKTSWRCLQDMSSRRLQYVFSVTTLVFQDVLKTSWRHLARRLEDVLEDKKLLRWETSSRHVFKMSWRHVFKISSSCLGNKKMGISLSKKSKWVCI